MEIARQFFFIVHVPFVLLLFCTFTNTSPVEPCCHNETNFIKMCCWTGLGSNISSCCNSSGCMNQNVSCPLKQLHIGAFIRFANEDRYAYKKAMVLAMDMINNNTNILPGYQIVLHFGDTYWVSTNHTSRKMFSCLLFHFCRSSLEYLKCQSV